MIPKRLLEGEGTELECLLLASGRAVRPNARAKWRTALLFFFMSLGTISKAHAVALLGAKARAWTVAQFLALGVGTGVAGWVAVHATADPAMAVIDPAPRRVSAAPVPRHEPALIALPAPPAADPVAVAETSPPTARPALQAPSTAPRAKRSAAAPAEPTAAERSVASEVEELDRARDALGTGEPKRAIDRLNRYDRLFPQGILREEALRLRIEAVAATGERAATRSLAQRFQSLYPNSTHSERLKALVREP